MLPFLELRRAAAELRGDLDAAIERVLNSGRFIGGEEVERFESEFAAYCGARFCVGVGNGLDALTLMLRAAHIGPGDEVLVPSNTYIATWLAVTAAGARPVPGEPELDSANLDPNRVSDKIGRRTRAVLAVHLYGRSANMGALNEIAGRNGLLLCVDAAQAHGIPSTGHPTAFSFYPSKNLGALGDGGAVVTDDPDLASRVRVLANYGSRQKYRHELMGVNSRLDPMQAAILGVKLKHLDEWNGRRERIARRYLEGLGDVPGLILPPSGSHSRTVWHVFAARYPERDWLAERLFKAGVETLIHYPVPPHLSGAYRSMGFRRGDFPYAEQIADEELSLPLHPHLADEEADQVIHAVRFAADCEPRVRESAA